MVALPACLLVAVVASATVLAAQERGQDTEMVRVTVHVRDADTDFGLMGALIELSGHSRRYVTAMNGVASFDVPMGDYSVTAHKGGYATLRAGFRATRAGHVTLLMHALGEVDTDVPGRLLVRVAEFGSGRLIEGAGVSLSQGQGRLTDGQGWVEFSDLDGPAAEVTVQMFGYETRTEPVSLREGRSTVVEVAMAIDAVVLAPIEVRAGSRFLEKHGVYWRIDRGWPKDVVGREELIERGEPYLSDAFRHLSWVRVETFGHYVFLKNFTGCLMSVYLDGWPLGFWGLTFDDVAPEELELVELYQAPKMPGRFASGCGVILLWSRMRARGDGAARPGSGRG